MLYCHSVAYAASAEGGLHPRDPRLAIDWPLPIAALSPRDEAHAFDRRRFRRARAMKCRHCAAELDRVCLDLGSAPPSNAYLSEAALRAPEVWYPLRLLVCERCWLVQTEDHAGREALFSDDYAYFSSFSSSWLAHARAYVEAMRSRFALTPASLVSEVAANDGYLLRYVRDAGIPCFGVEPTASTATAARALGLEIVERFFGVALGQELAAAGRQVDLVAANNVLAHVPDINDFVGGFTALLKPDGVATFEFPHLLRLLEENQFDTVYHEHYSYLSLNAVARVFERNGLAVFDVEALTTHGGSLRVFAQRRDTGRRPTSDAVRRVLDDEVAAGLTSAAGYEGFQARIDKVKDDFVSFLIEARRAGRKVAAYGAAAKGNTLMNYAGVRPDLIAYVVDRNPAKQGRFMPGSRIPIVDEARLRADRPDDVVLLPWNLRDELMAQLDYVRGLGRPLRHRRPRAEVRAVKVAVSGATGFVGRHVVAALERAGVEPTLWVRPSSPPSTSRHRVARIDIADPPAQPFDLLGRPDVLIHLAWGGLPNYPSLHHFERELPAHYALLKRLVDEGLSTLVVAGTCFEYGMQSGPLAETLAAAPANPYALAKDALRRQLQELQRERPFALTWARLFYLYGEGQAETALWSQLRRAVESGAATFPMSGGEQLRDYLPVELAADHLVALAMRRREHGIVNVCSGQPVSVRSLVEGWLAANAWTIGLDLGRYPYPAHEPMAFWGDAAKLKRCLQAE